MNILCSSSSVHMVQAGITIGNRLGINSGYRNNEKAEISERSRISCIDALLQDAIMLFS